MAAAWFLEEIDLVETGLAGGFAQDVQRLVIAYRTDRAAELHRTPKQGRSQRLAELGAGGQADVFEDVRGDAGDGLLGARVQVVAEHRFRALHQVAFVFLEIGFQRFVTVDRILQQVAGTAFLAGTGFHPFPAQRARGFAAQRLRRALLAGGARRAALSIICCSWCSWPSSSWKSSGSGTTPGKYTLVRNCSASPKRIGSSFPSCTMAAAGLLVPKSMPRRMGSSGAIRGAHSAAVRR